MKKILKMSFLSVMGFSIGACTINPLSPPLPDRNLNTDAYYEARNERDEDRATVIQRERDRYKGQTCEELSGREQDDCEELCEDMYSARGDRGECEELEVRLIEDLSETYEKLEEADDLKTISSNLFEAYLNVGVSGLTKMIGRYSKKEAEDFLLWLLENVEIAKIFEKEDDDFRFLISLLESFDSDYDADKLNKILTKRVDGDELMLIAINTDEEFIVDWLMDFINETDSNCRRDTETSECFRIYCSIGDELNDDERYDWLDYDEFEEYIDDIIEEKVNSRNADSNDRDKYNANGWRYGRENIEDLGDVDDWVDDLCHNLRSNN